MRILLYALNAPRDVRDSASCLGVELILVGPWVPGAYQALAARHGAEGAAFLQAPTQQACEELQEAHAIIMRIGGPKGPFRTIQFDLS